MRESTDSSSSQCQSILIFPTIVFVFLKISRDDQSFNNHNWSFFNLLSKGNGNLENDHIFSLISD